jgi:hypothetical protein
MIERKPILTPNMLGWHSRGNIREVLVTFNDDKYFADIEFTTNSLIFVLSINLKN